MVEYDLLWHRLDSYCDYGSQIKWYSIRKGFFGMIGSMDDIDRYNNVRDIVTRFHDEKK